jgi:NAD(P)-dependent dehydrogenase (short-subunit alcohol dehydrogenase family)
MKRIVLITGGTGSLGTATARAFLDEGDTAVVTYRKADEFRALAELLAADKGRLHGFETDVTSAESVAATAERIEREVGPLEVLAHVVGGYAGDKGVAETPDATWDHMMSLNLKSAFYCARAVLPGMLERGRGKIVTVASRAALQVFPGVGAYAASKAGLIALTQVIAAEGAARNVQANAVLPSVIDTAANREAMPNADFARWVKPAEVAAVIVFLASHAADKINGAAVPVYGRA